MWSATLPWPCTVDALAGLLNELQGSELAIVGSDPPTAVGSDPPTAVGSDPPTAVGSDPPTADAGHNPGGAWPVSGRGQFADWPLIRHVPWSC